MTKIWRNQRLSSLARQEYPLKKLFFGIALRPEHGARPSSPTKGAMWLRRAKQPTRD